MIIGSGNIGKRHLESLKKIKISTNISLVDINEKNLNTSKLLINKKTSKNKFSINYYNSINLINSYVDIAIISTNADVRYEVIRNLVKNKNPAF